MKPRIRFARGRWSCRDGLHAVAGIGGPPAEAYEQWQMGMVRVFGASWRVGS